MSLSITGGRFKGSILRTPAGDDLTRPTSGKVRQALFNILRGRVEDGEFLDLFAGSGAVGFEALSRGCSRAVLVESHPAAFKVLEANARLLAGRGAEPGSLQCVRQDAAAFCGSAAREGRRFATVFADPPFSQDFSGLRARLAPLVAEGGLCVVQFPTRKPPEWVTAAENAPRVHAYGESSLAVFEAAHC